MSWTTHIIVGTDEPIGAVRGLIESELGGKFIYPEDENEEPYLVHERADVYVGPNEFDDDEALTYSDGSVVPLRSQYHHNVEVRDIDKDIDRQQALGRRIFDAFKSGRWKLVFIDDMQHVIDSYDPKSDDPRGG